MCDAVPKKATTYNRESDHHGATLLPFIITTVDGFTPRSSGFDARGQLNPKDALNAIFNKGVPPMRGTIPTSIEEGLVRSIAADAICGDRNVLYDQTLSRSSGIAMLHNRKTTVTTNTFGVFRTQSFVALRTPFWMYSAATSSAPLR